MLQRHLDSEAKVDYFDALEVIDVVDNHVAGLHVPVHVLKAVDVLEAQEYAADDFRTLLIGQGITVFNACTTSPLDEVSQRPAAGVLDGQDDVV